MEVVLEFEGRSKLLKFGKTGSESDVRKAFEKLCSTDPVLMRRSKTHYATFKTYNGRLKRDIELDPGERLRNGVVVKVFFASYAALELLDDEMPNTSSRNSDTGAHVNTQGYTSDDLTFMDSLGLHKVSTSAQPLTQVRTAEASVSGVSSSASTGHSLMNKRKEDDLRLGDSSDDDQDYTINSDQAKQNNLNRLKELNIDQVVNQLRAPQLNKARRPKRKGAIDKENREEMRKMPPRAVKAKKQLITEFELEEEEAAIDEGCSPSEQGPLGGITKKKNTINRRVPQKKRRTIGQRITQFTPLPEFPKLLRESIEKDLVYVHQTLSRRMNKFLIKHIKDVTGDEYCSKEEHRILRDQVINRLKTMNITNLKIYKRKLIKSLSASLQNRRNYEWNKLPKRLSQKEAALAAAQQVASISASIRYKTHKVLDAEEADELLKRPVMNTETVKMALNAESARVRNSFMRKTSLREAMETYPYLKETDLLLHDYSTRVPLQLELIKENFENALLPLSLVFSVDRSNSELERVQLLVKINEYFDEENDNNFPCLQLWDAANSGADPLNNIPASQSAALVCIVNDKELVSCVLVFDTECLFTLRKPTAFKSVALLLSVYFVFQIGYPKPYEKLLHTIQHILHGEKNHHKLVKAFFKTLTEAQKILKASKK